MSDINRFFSIKTGFGDAKTEVLVLVMKFFGEFLIFLFFFLQSSVIYSIISSVVTVESYEYSKAEWFPGVGKIAADSGVNQSFFANIIGIL